jgi:hypothetical protein
VRKNGFSAKLFNEWSGKRIGQFYSVTIHYFNVNKLLI